MMNFQETRATRYESRTVANYSFVQKLTPVMSMLVEGGEAGMVSQDISVELDPIPGRLLTPITAQIFAVFVPLEAIDTIVDPLAAYAGMTEVVREKLITGNVLFTLEDENEISQRCAINPKSMSGAKRVCRMVRIGHNAAVNFLRRRVHKDAVQLLVGNMAVTPALLSSTSLTRLNGVLDPDDRVNGVVSLDLPQMSLPLAGSAPIVRTGTNSPLIRNATTGALLTNAADYALTVDGPLANLQNTGNVNAAIDPNGSLTATLSGVTATLNAVTAGNVSLVDFYNAETMDRLTRTMGQIMEANPEFGEEMVLRWAHGLSVDTGNMPFILAEQTKFFAQSIVGAMDTAGVQAETIRSDMAARFSFSVPIPKTELGGMIYTFLSVKPDETLGSQPHPQLADGFVRRNFVADQLALDPDPVRMRELNSDIPMASETTIAMYTGKNELVRNYTHYGFGRNVNPALLANKMAIWQLQIPLSVTPTTVLHPDTPDQSIFANTTAQVVRYTCAHRAVVKTPIIFGPSPVETLPIINSADIFNQVP